MVVRLAAIGLLAVTAIWGWTFVAVHDAVAVYGVVAFLAMRFVIATVAMGSLWGRHLTRPVVTTGVRIGLLLAAGYLLQTWGLRHTTATNSGLITGLFVVVAPIADRVIYRNSLHPLSWAAVAVSIAGMTLLTGVYPTQMALGDLLTLGCALAFGVHIAVLSHHAPYHDPRALATAQIGVTSLVFLLLWPLVDDSGWPPPEVWPAIILTGLVASALAYAIQTAAQRHLSAVRTAVILTTEPVFAGLFGYLLAGERLTGLQLIGAALIISALALSEVIPAWLRRARQGADSGKERPEGRC
jgi:drug/metabolite transporter (DMT)-like permease